MAAAQPATCIIRHVRVSHVERAQQDRILAMQQKTNRSGVGTLSQRRLTGAPIVLPLITLAALLPWLLQVDVLLHGMLLTAQLAICAAGIAISFVRGLRPVALVFYAFSLAWLGIGPTYQLAVRQIPWNDQELLTQPAEISAALSLTLLSTVMFVAGNYLYDRKKRKRSDHPQSTFAVRTYLTWAYIAGAVALSPFAIRAAGGVSGLFTTRGDRADALLEAGISITESGGVQLALAKILPAALALAASYTSIIQLRSSWIERGFSRVYGRELAATVISIILLVIYCNPLVSSRFLSVLAFGSLIMIAIQPRTPRGGKIFATLAIMGTVIVYPLANVFRAGIDNISNYKTGLEAFAGMDFDGFQQVVNALVFVRETGHSWGHYSSSALLYFIPRSVWVDKASPASIDVAANRGYAFTNLSIPLHAELYIEFGIIGMAACLFVFGWFCSRSDYAWLHGLNGRMGVLAPMLAMAMLGLLRGPLGSLAPVYVTALALTFFALKVRTGSPGLVETATHTRREEALPARGTARLPDGAN